LGKNSNVVRRALPWQQEKKFEKKIQQQLEKFFV
jgi:hypothetical protein